MSEERKYYCFCQSNCKYETMTKEQILAAIAQAVETGVVGNVDTGFITKVKEGNSGGYVTFWAGTQAEYNALAKKEKNCLYIFTDDTTEADLNKLIHQLTEDFEKTARAAAEATKAAAHALQKTGDAMQGTITTKGIVLTQGVDYGKTLPTTGTAGQLFFLEEEE